MPDLEKLSVEQFKLACVSDDVLTDEQVVVLTQTVALESESDVLEFEAVLQKYRPNLVRRFFLDRFWTKEEILEMWPQAAGELHGLLNHFLRTNARITASQLGMALQLAEEEYKRLREEK